MKWERCLKIYQDLVALVLAILQTFSKRSLGLKGAALIIEARRDLYPTINPLGPVLNPVRQTLRAPPGLGGATKSHS